MHFRLALVAAVAVLVVLSLADFQDWRSEGRRLAAILDHSGVASRHPEVAARAVADPDSMRARVRVARALLADETDLSRLAGLPPEEAVEELRRGAYRLDLAVELAEEVLASRPASWQAAFVLGAARYLALARRRDPRLAIDPGFWEAPLETAHRLAPGQPEPLRFLAAAYMSDWSRLSAERRQLARQRIGEALQDPRSFDPLIVDWLRVAGSFNRALELVPDRREAWETLRRIYRDRGDLERYREVHARWFDSLGAWLDGLEAGARSSWRTLGGSRPLGLLNRVLELPADPRFAAALERELQSLQRHARRPPGQHVRRWLAWALEACLLDECPLTPASLGRMRELADRLPDHLAAHAALESGDLELAESFEVSASDQAAPEWAPYLIAKAKALAARGDPRRAIESLSRIDASARDSAVYWMTLEDISSRFPEVGGQPEAMAEIRARRRDTWSRDHWTRIFGGPIPRLEILPTHPSSGLTLAFDPAATGDRVLEVRLDDRVVEFLHVSGAETEELELALSSDIHLLQVFPVVGGYLYPQRVSLSTGRPGS